MDSRAENVSLLNAGFCRQLTQLIGEVGLLKKETESMLKAAHRRIDELEKTVDRIREWARKQDETKEPKGGGG